MRGIRPGAGLALLSLVSLAGCFQPPPGSGTPGAKPANTGPLLADPQILGTVSLTQGGATQNFSTYAFKTGAFNATAWFGHRDKIYYLNIRAFPNKNPNAAHGLLSVVALLPDTPVTGMTSDSVTVKLIDHGPIADVPRWSSIGQPAHLEITSLQPIVGSTPPAATMAGVLTATICSLAAPTDKPDCVDVTGGISTEVQYNYP